jgi:hypothetical protein
MTRGRARTHLDATQAHHRVRQALCGYTNVTVEIDISKVDCVLCRRLFAAGDKVATKRKTSSSRAEIVDALGVAVAELLAPKAGAPPRLTPAMWAGSCRGGEHRRCGECELCLHDREMAKWEHAAPDRYVEQRVVPLNGRPRWSSLAAAIVQLVEYERHGRAGPSAAGGILQRIELGPIDGIARADDPLMRRGAELVAVRKALEFAYPVGGHAVLTSAQCQTILVCRTPGVLAPMPSFEVLAMEHGVSEGDVRAVVRHGRDVVTCELAERGLIPWPSRRRGVEQSATWIAGAVDAQEAG